MKIILSISFFIMLMVVKMMYADNIVFRVQDKILHTLDPRLFGQFMERPSWGEIGPEGALVPGTNRLQPEVLKLIEEMKIPIIRFPGGTDVGFMDWRDMVSNIPGRGAERPLSTGKNGDKVTNNFGYDEFLRLCKELKSEPIIVVNLRQAVLKKKPLKEAVLDAAGLVAYCNARLGAKLPRGMVDWPAIRAKNGHPEPYGVKHWQIGNETWFFFSKMTESTPKEAEKHYADCLAAYARGMLAVDPTIELIVDGQEKTLKPAQLVRKEFTDRIRHMVFHVYQPWSIKDVTRDDKVIPLTKLSDEDIWKAWTAVPDFDKEGLSVLSDPLLAEARRMGQKVAVTEWNWNGGWSVWGTPAMNSSLARGVGAAGFVHALMRSGDVIEIGCQSMLVGNFWKIHAIRADRKGIKPPRYMPTGQVTMLYSQHHGPDLLAVEASGIPTYSQPFEMARIKPKEKVAYIDALATAGEDTLFVHIISRQFKKPSKITIDVTALKCLPGKGKHYMLTGRLNDRPKKGQSMQIGKITCTEVTYDGKILNVVLPPRTVSVIELPRQ